MFPSSDDKTKRSDGHVSLDEPTPLDSTPTLQAACAYIVARLRYDFVSGRDSIAAYVDVTQPWNDPSYPNRTPETAIAIYSALLEVAVFTVLDDALPITRVDPMINFIISKVIIKDSYRGTFRIFIKADVINRPVLAAA